MIEHLFIDEKGAPPSKRRAVARVLVVSMLLCFPMGIAIVEFVKATQMAGYAHASGTITSSAAIEDTESLHREAPYGAVHKAKFDYGGRTRIGSTSRFGTLTSDAAEADAIRRKHPAGSTVDVWFVPPKLPEIFIARPSTLGPAIAIGAVGVLWLFMLWIYFIPQLTQHGNRICRSQRD
ncbi:hypothetical protein BH09PLA1_BH09PLA1_04480 [soil metagenome]